MTAPTYDVLSYGTIGLDYIIRVPDWPTPERGVHAPDESEHLGGKATNVAIWLGHWGARVALCGNILGSDQVAERIIQHLDAHPNISREYLEQQNGSSMYCRILVNPAGERAIIGINVDEARQVEPTRKMVADAAVVTLDLYGREERVTAARLAKEIDRPVIVGDLRRADHPVLPFTTLAISSGAEIRRDDPARSSGEFAAAVDAAGTPQVIITNGSDDVAVYENGSHVATITPPQMDVVDATGAGDAFRAGVTYGMLQEASLVECAALGTAAGSLNVTCEGGASAPVELDRVWDLAGTLI